MKNIVTRILALSLIFFSCNKDAKSSLRVSSKKITDLHAPYQSTSIDGRPSLTGAFVKFNFDTGKSTIDEKNWHIALRGTDVLVNSGQKSTTDSYEPNRTGEVSSYVTMGIFGSVKIDSSSLTKDSDSVSKRAIAKSSWYNYDSSIHSINPISGKILVFKISDKKYVKMEVSSYYKRNQKSAVMGVTTLSIIS